MRILTFLSFMLSILLMILFAVDLIHVVSRVKPPEETVVEVNIGDAVNVKAGAHDFANELKRSFVTYLLPAFALLLAGIVLDNNVRKHPEQ